MTDFERAGVQPDMVQIGNEISHGFLWPLGKWPSVDGGKTLSALLASGLKAVHDVDPAHKTKTLIHLPDGGDNALYQRFFDMLTKDNGVNDFDIIGVSYYPFWHGTLDQLQANINDISQRYNKDVIVVETAYGYTTKNFDQMAIFVVDAVCAECLDCIFNSAVERVVGVNQQDEVLALMCLDVGVESFEFTVN